MPKLSEHMVIVDANFADSVAYDFKVNVALKVKRDLPDVDLPAFLVCCALDGGLEPGENEVMNLLVCHKGETKMGHLAPKDIAEELDGKAFEEPKLGEFSCHLLEEPDEDWLGGESLLLQVVRMVMTSKDVKRLTVVADWDEEGEDLVEAVQDMVKAAQEEDSTPKQVTFVTDRPDEDQPAYTVMHIGYAIMHCLGVGIDELK